MTSLPTRQGQAGGPGENSSGLTRTGQVFLDVARRHLAFLDPVARQLYDEGVPFTPTDLAKHRLLTLTGQAVTGAELPLVVAWREARPVEATFALFRETGAEWRVNWNAAPIRGSAGQVVGVAGVIRCGPPEPDWQAMAGLAHDMRTPLNAITLQLAVLNHIAEANPDLAKVLSGLHSSAERALRVGLELLNWCRGPGQRGRLVEPTWFALEPLLEDLAREQRLSAKSKGLTLATDFAACQGWEVHTDRVRLARILSNLLVNAVRYTPRGRVEFAASWRDEPKCRLLAIGVVDTGIGITSEEQESIFQPFERGRAGKEGDSGGSGLGLAVVDQLVEELGLELEVFSQHGHGSEFHLLFPASMARLAKTTDTHSSPGETVREPQ